MDEVRDIQKTESPTRFIDQRAVRTNPFGENRAAERAYRRAERIVAGIFMLTNHISPSEPIRVEIRSTATGVLNGCIKVRDVMRSSQSPEVTDLQARIRYLISLVRVMAVSGFVSQANADVVTDALDDLGNFLVVSQRSILSENVALNREDLVDVKITPTFRSAGTRIIKDMSDIKDTASSQGQKDDGQSADSGSRDNGQHSVRVQGILDVLRAGGSLGIKDIAANLPEYSEKMIQRELLSLVSLGSVKKAGSKRWSRYSLGA